MLDRLKHIAALTRLMVEARVADPSVIEQLQRFNREAEAKIQTQRVSGTEMDYFVDEYGRIIDAGKLNNVQYQERTRQLTRGASDSLYAKDHQANLRHFQVLAYLVNPKIRALSETAQQSEQELVTAFNKFAYAGLGEPEAAIAPFLEAIDKYE
ncbi:hypothetical protein KR222_007388 [Zaprionus bogoriensis]|nr:hypothetical protein KR222_007388 [Zaprionus bogoriensis]